MIESDQMYSFGFRNHSALEVCSAQMFAFFLFPEAFRTLLLCCILARCRVLCRFLLPDTTSIFCPRRLQERCGMASSFRYGLQDELCFSGMQICSFMLRKMAFESAIWRFVSPFFFLLTSLDSSPSPKNAGRVLIAWNASVLACKHQCHTLEDVEKAIQSGHYIVSDVCVMIV